ncbi:hypothetical protein HanRHA438_Chr01g0005801 [Helianthus annuus]|nr:hypothetical protein HanRHA438_Chr01g0005801 [Helianthus annuus]KAJ0955640.1 hypothetical protein HanPSC8_Chr01g0005151 [Helianthus annuus]
MVNLLCMPFHLPGWNDLYGDYIHFMVVRRFVLKKTDGGVVTFSKGASVISPRPCLKGIIERFGGIKLKRWKFGFLNITSFHPYC